MKVGVVVFMLAAAFMHVQGQEVNELEIICPELPPMDCGEGMIPCPGDMDTSGCVGPSSCMPEDVGCTVVTPDDPPAPPPVECPAELPPQPDCGEENVCSGGMDLLGCPAPDFCAPNGEACPEGTE